MTTTNSPMPTPTTMRTHLMMRNCCSSARWGLSTMVTMS